MGICLLFLGDFLKGLPHFERAIELYDPAEHRPLATLFGTDTRYPVHDEELFMEEAVAAIRQAITKEEARETTLAPAEPWTSREQAGAKSIAEAGLLSRQATAAVGSAFNTLTETVRKHEPTLEDVVRETLRPMLKSWLDENLPRVVERMVQAEVERITRGR